MGVRREGYRPFDYYQNDEQLREVIEQIIRGDFSRKNRTVITLSFSLQYHVAHQSFNKFRSSYWSTKKRY